MCHNTDMADMIFDEFNSGNLKLSDAPCLWTLVKQLAPEDTTLKFHASKIAKRLRAEYALTICDYCDKWFISRTATACPECEELFNQEP